MSWQSFMANPGSSGLLGGAASVANAFINNAFNRANMKQQQEYIQQNMQLSQNLNKEFQSFVWDNQMPAQVAAMKNAGLNPALANTSLAGGSAPTPGLSSAAPSSQFAGFNVMEGFGQMAKALSDIASANKTSGEAKVIWDSMDDVLKGIHYDTELKDAYNRVTQATAMAKADAEVKNIVQDTFLKMAQADEALSNSDLAFAKKQSEEINRLLLNNKAKMTNEQYELLKKEKELYDTRFNQEMRESESRIGLNKASAYNAHQQGMLAVTQSVLNDQQRDIIDKTKQYIIEEKRWASDNMKYQSRINKDEVALRCRTLESRILDYLSQGLISYNDKLIAEENLRRARVDNNLRAYHETLDFLERVNNGVTAYIPFAPERTSVSSASYNGAGKLTGRTTTTTSHSRYIP